METDYERSQRPARRRRVEGGLAGCLSLTAGYVDAYGLVVLGTYVSLMSGNSTTMAVELGKGHFAQAAPAARRPPEGAVPQEPRKRRDRARPPAGRSPSP